MVTLYTSKTWPHLKKTGDVIRVVDTGNRFFVRKREKSHHKISPRHVEISTLSENVGLYVYSWTNAKAKLSKELYF